MYINESSLYDFVPILDEEVENIIHVDGFRYEFFSYISSTKNKICVLGQDAVPRSKRKLPHYYRWTWYSEVDSSVISLNDPTLYLDESISGGWLLGQGGFDPYKVYIDILDRLFKLLGLDCKDVIFFGASAGGLSAIKFATYFRGSVACVDIPQVDLTKYHILSAVDTLVEHCFLGDRDAMLADKSRLSALAYMTEARYIPEIFYYQNINDSAHIRTQLNPFIVEIGILWQQKDVEINKLHITYYVGRSGRGHSPMGKEGTLEALNRLCRR